VPATAGTVALVHVHNSEALVWTLCLYDATCKNAPVAFALEHKVMFTFGRRVPTCTCKKWSPCTCLQSEVSVWTLRLCNATHRKSGPCTCPQKVSVWTLRLCNATRRKSGPCTCPQKWSWRLNVVSLQCHTQKKWPLYLSTKNTILKKYDGRYDGSMMAVWWQVRRQVRWQYDGRYDMAVW